MSSLTGPLQKTPIDANTKNEIIHSLWPRNHSKTLQPDDLDWNAYFTYYTRQCTQALHNRGRHNLCRIHQDVVDIAQLLEELSTKDAVKESLRSKLRSPTKEEEDEILDNSVDLAARLLVMMDIGVLQYAYSGRPELTWTAGSLKDFVTGYFSQPQVLGHDNVRLEKTFTARNLGRIAGIDIEWTDNLYDHLRMVDEDKRVAIFRHATFLKWQDSQIFPNGLIRETLNTLALLFPQGDKDTQKWFNKQPYSYHLDKTVIKCGQLRADDRQIEKFRFYRDRLIILKQVYDQSSPSTPSQWWYDRRNGVQWYTFWIAALVLLLTVVFGLAQSIEGALQVYKAYHPS